MSGFAGRIDHDAIGKLFFRALRSGSATKGNRFIEFKGTAWVVETHYGKLVELGASVIRCKYFWSWIFCIDFDRRRMTDYSMADYSSSTGQTLSAYEQVVCAAAPQLIHRDMHYYYRRWTREPSKRRMHPTPARSDSQLAFDVCFERFRKKLPWMKFEDGHWWFYWDKYDSKLVEQYQESMDFLRSEQNWRYFTFDWDRGVWKNKFIDEGASRRWHARQNKRERTNIREGKAA